MLNSFHLSNPKRKVALLYGSTLAGTIFGVLCSIVNTRFLDPSNYGDVRYVQNIIQFIASLLLLGYFLSGSRLLALSDNEKTSREIRGGMVLLLVATSIVLMLALIICSAIHSTNPKISRLFIISLPVCFNTILGNYIGNTAQGDNHIGRLSVSRLVPYALYFPIAYLVYKYTGATSEKMILLQWGIYTIVSLVIVISTRPSFRNIRKSLYLLNEENKRYGIQLYYGSLVMIGTTYLAGISLGMFNEDNTNVGFYTLALTVTTPLAMLPGIIGTTYFKEFAKMDRIPKKVMKTTIIVTVLSCMAFIIIIKPVVIFLYSKQYGQVGVYAVWLSIGWCIHGIGDMINRYLGSHGLGKEIRNSSFACGFLKLFGFTVLVYFWNINGAIITNIVASTVYCLILFYYYIRFINTGSKGKYNEVTAS